MLILYIYIYHWTLHALISHSVWFTLQPLFFSKYCLTDRGEQKGTLVSKHEPPEMDNNSTKLCITCIYELIKALLPLHQSHQPSSPNSFVNLSCTSRSALLTVGFCRASTLLKSALVMGGGRTCKVIDLKCILSLFVTKKSVSPRRNHRSSGSANFWEYFPSWTLCNSVLFSPPYLWSKSLCIKFL